MLKKKQGVRLRNQLKRFNSEYNKLEQEWLREPSHFLAWSTLKLCKKIRDMFDPPGTFEFDEAAWEPMVCHVDVVGHYNDWAQRVSVWRERFNR